MTDKKPLVSDEEIRQALIDVPVPEEGMFCVPYARRLLRLQAERLGHLIAHDAVRTEPVETTFGKGVDFGMDRAARIIRESVE